MSTNSNIDPRRDCIHSWSANRPLTDEEYLEQLKARFWAKVDKAPGQGPKGECWTWTGSLVSNKNGCRYGQLGFRWPNGSRRPIHAHVASFYIHTGKLPDLHVLHKCDNPPCVNPAHLWEGSHRQNMNDMHRKGRAFRPRKERPEPDKAVRVKVTPRQGEMITRARKARDIPQPEVAAMLGLDVTHYCRFEKAQRAIYLEQLHCLLTYLAIDQDTFNISESEARDYGERVKQPGRKLMGGMFKPYIKFQTYRGRMSRAARRANFLSLPAPDLTFYRADLIRHYLKRKDVSFDVAITNSGVSVWSFKKVLLGENCRRETVMRVARFAGLSESQVFNTQEAKAA